MHILVIPSWYKSDQYPFMGSFFEEQARALIKAGHQVSIFFPSIYPISAIFKDKPKYQENWDDNGLTTYATVVQGIVPRSLKFNNFYLKKGSDKLFRKYIKEHGKPDIIHAHSIFDGGVVGEFLSKKYQIPLVNTEHLTHFTGSLAGNKPKIDLARKIFNSAVFNIAVSMQFKKDLERELNLPENSFKVVYNMVADHFYDSFKPVKYSANEEFIFFTNSFLNERKNHTLLFDSLKLLVDKGLKVKLVVGGDGERGNFLKSYVKKHQLENHVSFLGGLNRQRVKEEIDKSHAFLLASKFESFGVVLIESIISGRPVISTNCGGPGEIVSAENGYLVNSFESKDFASHMEKMIPNYNDFDQAKMRDVCHKRFSEKTISGELIEIYKEAIQIYKQQSLNENGKWNLHQKAAVLGSWLFFLE